VDILLAFAGARQGVKLIAALDHGRVCGAVSRLIARVPGDHERAQCGIAGVEVGNDFGGVNNDIVCFIDPILAFHVTLNGPHGRPGDANQNDQHQDEKTDEPPFDVVLHKARTGKFPGAEVKNKWLIAPIFAGNRLVKLQFNFNDSGQFFL
jgi:hypothetical protein